MLFRVTAVHVAKKGSLASFSSSPTLGSQEECHRVNLSHSAVRGRDSVSTLMLFNYIKDCEGPSYWGEMGIRAVLQGERLSPVPRTVPERKRSSLLKDGNTQALWAHQGSLTPLWLHRAHNLKRLPTNIPTFSPFPQQELPP